MSISNLLNDLNKEYPDFEWNIPPQLDFGILSTNQAFILAKQQKGNPLAIATDLADQLQSFLDKHGLDYTVSTKGPYINLDVKNEVFADLKAEIQLQKIDKTVMLEFVSPNVGKPLHAGHILQANFGESLRKILSLKYKKLITDSHWCDWGVPMGIMFWAFKEIGQKTVEVDLNGQKETFSLQDLETKPMDTLVKIYVWGNQQKDNYDNWDELVRAEFVKLEKGDSQNVALKNKLFGISSADCHQILQLLNIKIHDLEQGESFYEPEVKKLVEFLDKENLWQKENLGRYIDLENLQTSWPDIPENVAKRLKSMGRCYLVQSKDGYTTYALRDIAARWQWARDLQADLMITMVGNEQKHHFEQFFTITGYLADQPKFQNFASKTVANRMQLANLISIHNGFLTLPEGRMSARKGKFVTAREILEQTMLQAKKVLQEKNSQKNAESVDTLDEQARKVAVAAMKWFNLNRDISQDVALDIQSILKFEGNTGVYQLYTLARLNSILTKLAQPSNISFYSSLAQNANIDLNLNSALESQGEKNLDEKPGSYQFKNIDLFNQEELDILKHTLLLPLILDKICQTYKPHLLTGHLFELSGKINSWYGKHSVTSEKNLQRQQELAKLCDYLKNYIIFCLDLLGIEKVDNL